MTSNKKMKDKDATELDWFFLELFGKKIFGERHQFVKPEKKKIHLVRQVDDLKS